MSASNAQYEISSLIDPQPQPDAFSEYADSQTSFLTPINIGSYSSGQINWDLKQWRSKFFVPSSSYILLPLKLRSSGTVYTANTRLAFKRSVLDLVNGILLQSSGTTILNCNQTMAYNNLMLRLGSDLGWRSLNGDDLMTDFDTFQTDITGVGVSSSGFANPNEPTNEIVTPATQNLGLRNRMIFLKQKCGFTSGAQASLDLIVKLPLKYLHSLFQSLDFPLINNTFLLSLYLNLNTNNTPYPPMCCPLNTGAADPAPVITVESVTVDGFILDNPRFYANLVSFQADATSTISNALRSGFVKKINFYESELIRLNNNTALAQGGQNLNTIISSSVVAPSRVFILTPLAGTSTSATGISNSSGRFSSIQFTVNNVPVYQIAPQNQYEIYQLLKDEFSNSDSDIAPSGYSYQTWYNGNSVLAVNFTKRMKDRLNTGNESVSIGCNLQTVPNNPSVDIFAIVERKMTLIMRMSESGIEFTVGQGEI